MPTFANTLFDSFCCVCGDNRKMFTLPFAMYSSKMCEDCNYEETIPVEDEDD